MRPILNTQFWDGREPSLESQSAQPFLNPVEMGLENHDPILKIVRTDPEYVDLFKKAFGKSGDQITMVEVQQAIATFQRTLIAGNSPFDRYYFGGDKTAMSPAAIRGLDIFIGQGRCVSCHVIEQTQALFTDNRFHMIGVAAHQMPKDLDELSAAVEDVKKKGTDIAVLSNEKTSSLGRFRRDAGPHGHRRLQDLHDPEHRSHRPLHARREPQDPGGGRPVLQQRGTAEGERPSARTPERRYPAPQPHRGAAEADLVEFMKALTSPEFVRK